MVDRYDDSDEDLSKNGSNILNQNKKKPRQTAVALKGDVDSEVKIPHISAAGRGKIAEQILQMAFDNGVKVREDSALAEMLAAIELDSPIPSEAYLAVAEILSYVYKANGEPNPFDAILKDAMNEHTKIGESNNEPE